MNEKRVFPILGRIQSIVLPETNRVEQMKPIVFFVCVWNWIWNAMSETAIFFLSSLGSWWVRLY